MSTSYQSRLPEINPRNLISPNLNIFPPIQLLQAQGILEMQSPLTPGDNSHNYRESNVVGNCTRGPDKKSDRRGPANSSQSSDNQHRDEPSAGLNPYDPLRREIDSITTGKVALLLQTT